MLKWISKIFASDKVVESGLSMIDKAFHTDQEKAEGAERMTKHKDNFIANWIESSKSSNLARRYLAMLVASIWSFLFLFSWASQQMAVWSDSVDDKKLALMQEINAPFLDQATGGMMLVLAFYFAAPYMGSIVSGAMNKFSGKKPDKNT